MRWISVLLLVLMVAGGAWFVLAGRDATEGDGEEIERTPADASSVDLVTLRGRSDAEAPDTTGSAAAAAATDDASAGTADARTLLRGILRGFDPTREGSALIRVFPVRSSWVDQSWRSVDGAAHADGTFELDVTDLMTYPGDLTHLEVRVDHPAYVQGRVRADVAAVRAAGRGELSVEVTLHLGLAVTGEVRTESGDPIHDAKVAIFTGRSTPTGADAPMREPADATVRTDAEGRYRLRVQAHGDYRVVAVQDERLPAGARVTLQPGGAALVPPLVLRPGVALAGRVRFRETWIPNAWIEAVPAGHDRLVPMEVGQRSVAWTAEGPVPTTTWVQADADGRFRVAGLAPGAHMLDPSRLPAGDLPHITRPVSQSLAHEVLAPSDDLILEIGGVVLEVHVVGAGRPASDAEVEIETGGTSLYVRTDAEGIVRFLVAPSAACTLRVRKEEFLDGERKHSVGAAGTTEITTVELQPAAPSPKLFVALTGPHVKTVAQAAFSLQDLAEPGRMRLDHNLRDEGKTGIYRIPDVEPGRYRLTVRPGSGAWGALGYFLPDVREVAIPPEGEVRLEVPLRLGGRLRIAARDVSGGLLRADCEIRDASGAVLDVRFTAQAERMATTGAGRLGALSPSIVGPPLPAGTYSIELSMDGYEVHTVTAQVRENGTTEVDVSLAAR